MDACDSQPGALGVSLQFVLPQGENEVSVSSSLSQAYEQCREAGLDPVWRHEQELVNIKPQITDVFVLDPFSGPGFQHVSSQPCTVLGPQCLLSCLSTNCPVPDLPYPVFTAAMSGLLVCFSGIQEEERNRLSHLVRTMAGTVTPCLHDGVTHLVSNTVTSDKYRVAKDYSIPCMTVSWVEEVWRLSSKMTGVQGNQAKFSSMQVPAMLGLTVSVTQLSLTDRELVKRTVEEAGGCYSPNLEKDSTSVLVCCTSSGPKYEAARRWGVTTVNTDWVFRSLEAGHCLPYTDFRVDWVKEGREEHHNTQDKDTSTNTVEPSTVGSNITDDSVNASTVDTTHTTVDYTHWLGELQLSKVRQAGSFLDGCKVFLTGFSDGDTVQLGKVLKYAGAVRLGRLVDSVTHVVVGKGEEGVEGQVENMEHRPHIVTLKWVVESMEQGSPASETEHRPSVVGTHGEQEENMEHSGFSLESVGEDNVFEASLLAQYGAGSHTSLRHTARF